MGTRRERLLQRINPNLLKMTPKLSGDAGSVIDLDSEDSLEDGAKKLMLRFYRNQDLCEKNKRNLAQHETELTITTAKYNENDEICQVMSESLILHSVRNEEDMSERPGKRLQQLKMELQEKMSAKWLEEYNKRVSEKEAETKPKRKKKRSKKKKTSDGEDEESNEKSDKEDYDDEANDADIEYEDEEEREKEVSSIASDTKVNECEDKIEDLEKGDEYDEDSGGCSLVPAYQPGGGMLYGGSELTQNDEGLPQNLLSPLKFSLSESFGCKISQSFDDETPKELDVATGEETNTSFSEKVKLFSQNPNDSFDLNDAFEFCSGKFPDAEEEVNDEGDGCDDFQSAVEEESDNCSQDLELGKKSPKGRKNIITFEDSEAEEENEIENVLNEGVDNAKLLSDDEDETALDKTELKKKARKNLQFSDEEDAGNECEEQANDSEDPEGGDDEAEPDGNDYDQRSIHYDSEENEIINPKEFFEKEAELSGSEWSGDEDEKGLDEFDVEEGDADNLDEDQVRSQLERIHVRRVLDDDAREVRLIQEILFEDGDLYTDGKVRERKFRWKNLAAFDNEHEGGRKEDAGNGSEDDCPEEEEEEEMRKIRHEKELFFMEKLAKKNSEVLSSDEEIVEDFHTVKVTSDKPPNNEKRTENSKTDYSEIVINTKVCNARGSFLARSEQFLSRLAKATSGVTDSILGPKNSKNFVFVTKSPEKINPDKSTACKRQSEESCGRREKKIKLLPQEIDTGPSILDLLV